jgi:hypothetical protein
MQSPADLLLITSCDELIQTKTRICSAAIATVGVHCQLMAPSMVTTDAMAHIMCGT